MSTVASPSRRSEQWRRETPAAARGSVMCGVLDTSSVPIDSPTSGKRMESPPYRTCVTGSARPGEAATEETYSMFEARL